MVTADHRRTLRIIVKYTLFQVPEFLFFLVMLIIAGHWINIPPWFWGGFIVLLIVKDMMLFPLVWRAYDNRKSGQTYPLIGKKGTVVESLNPTGYVQVNGELWKAKASGQGQTMEKGEYIHVEEVKGFCLIVGKTDSSGSNPGG